MEAQTEHLTSSVRMINFGSGRLVYHQVIELCTLFPTTKFGMLNPCGKTRFLLDGNIQTRGEGTFSAFAIYLGCNLPLLYKTTARWNQNRSSRLTLFNLYLIALTKHNPTAFYRNTLSVF